MDKFSNNKYVTPYQFGDKTEEVNKFINRLYATSLMSHEVRFKNNENAQKDIEKIQETLEYVDDYLHYYYKFNQNEFASILGNLERGLLCITTALPRNTDSYSYYGVYFDNEKTIYLNPNLQKSYNLSASERTRLYVCHELGHIQNSKWMDSVEGKLKDINCPDEDIPLICAGFSLIDEATTQDRAEDITHYFSEKIRPEMSEYSTNIYRNNKVNTNFDYYGEFQEPTISFAKTLRGIGKIDDNELVMEEFNKRSLDKNFTNDIINEYIYDNQLDNLYSLMKNLGKIKIAKYASFGQREEKFKKDNYFIDETDEALDQYNNLVVRMRDYRKPIKK